MTRKGSIFENITIYSGGQTGVDRAALEFAIEAGIPHAGWCPRGRTAEDGVIPSKFNLRETTSPDPAVRTRLNILDTDAILIITEGIVESPGTKLTLWFATLLNRPVLVIDRTESSSEEPSAQRLQKWLFDHPEIQTLNIAGPRASECPEIGDFSRRIFELTFQFGQLKSKGPLGV